MPETGDLTDAPPSTPAGEVAPADEPGATPVPFALGERVQLAQVPRYLKTADPMPMLRPPDLVERGEGGVVMEIRGRDQLAVRFRRGTFLMAARDLSPLPPERPAG
jgi:hypothetical protein